MSFSVRWLQYPLSPEQVALLSQDLGSIPSERVVQHLYYHGSPDYYRPVIAQTLDLLRQGVAATVDRFSRAEDGTVIPYVVVRGHPLTVEEARRLVDIRITEVNERANDEPDYDDDEEEEPAERRHPDEPDPYSRRRHPPYHHLPFLVTRSTFPAFGQCIQCWSATDSAIAFPQELVGEPRPYRFWLPRSYEAAVLQTRESGDGLYGALGVCGACAWNCPECDAALAIPPTLPDVRGMAGERACARCSLGRLTRVEPPKPNRVELRTYLRAYRRQLTKA